MSGRTESNVEDVAGFGRSASNVPTSATSSTTLMRRQSHEMKNPTTAEDVERLRIVEGLETKISDEDYISFLRELDNRNTGRNATSWGMEEKVVLEGFRLLRYHVVKRQMSSPDIVVLMGDGWVKTIKRKVDAFENSRLVAVSGLLTFLTLSSLPGNYKNMIVKRGGVDCAMKMLDNYRDDNEVCNLACALFLSLCLNEKEGLNATFFQLETLIKQLVSLITRGGYGSDFALRILFQLTSHKKKLPNSTKSLSYLVKNTFREEKNNTLALLNTMKNNNIRESTLEAALSLLWRLSVPKDEFDGDDPCLMSIDTIETIVVAMDMFDSASIREAACGVLANISIRIQMPEALARRSFLSIQKFLKREESVDEGLATCSLHAICNILEKPVVRAGLLLNQQMIETVMRMMGRFSKSEELIEFACLIIARAGRFDQTMKELFVSMGAFDLVVKAFEQFVTTHGHSPSLDVKDAILCAFATLTGCRIGALAAISTGLVDIFSTLLAVETDQDFAVVLDAIISNIRRCTTNDTVMTSPEDDLRNEPHLFSRLMENASNDSDVFSLIKVLLDTDETTLRDAFCSTDGFPALVSVMSQWMDYDKVQESGCLLLAEIYFRLPYPNDAMNILHGPWAAQNQRKALNTIASAMNSFPARTEIQVNGCAAILNLLLPISYTDRASLYRQAISPAVELSYNAILECLRANGSDNNIQEFGISALAVSVSVTETGDFQPWANRTVRQLIDVLLQFSGAFRIQELALDALITIQEKHTTINSGFISSDLDILLTLFDCEKHEISGRASRILSSLLHNSPKRKNEMLQSDAKILASLRQDIAEPNYELVHQEIRQRGTYIGRIISSAESKRDDLAIQGNVFSMVHALVTHCTDHREAIATILHFHRGIQTLCLCATSHPRDRQVAIRLCKILSSTVPMLDADGIASSRDAIKLSLIDLLESHIENPDVQSCIFDAFCTCCERDYRFKNFLLEETKARMTINTMQFCLGSESLQSSGCKLLSILSGTGTGKDMIGEYGGIPAVVNALLAHNDSAQVQKSGLVVLKNLATVPSNKRIIVATEAETTVIYALWIHHKDPEVISIGLSALNNMAVDSVSRSVAKMNEQVLNIVVAVMKKFPMDELVQKNACFYLKTCSYLSENIRMLCGKSDVLLPLLLQAGDNFPGTCGSRSAAVVTKLTSHY